MTLRRRLRAIALALSIAASGAPAHTDTLGVVMQARSASLSNGPVSAGASLFDGDRLSTEVDGALTLRSGASMVYLGRESRVTLHNATGEPKSAQVNLSAGTIVFSTAKSATMEICADEAHIRPATGAATLAQVTVSGPKALFVYARRGALQISYHEDSEIIAEGDSYRVVLDPPDDASAKTAPVQPEPYNGHRRKRLLLLLISAAAVGAAVAAASTTWTALKDYESPAGP